MDTCVITHDLYKEDLTLSLPEASIKSVIVLLTFKSVDETLVCDHSSESL